MINKKLNAGDVKLIAMAARCHRNSITLVIEGSRGAWKTDFQKRIKRIVEFRKRQNEALVKYCESIEQKVVSPKKVNK